MAYTVLARRYRSQDFDEVIGQEPIARTLQRAIESGRVAHAYLFSGTRGVGKTSMARILAKALNVTDEQKDADSIASAIMRGDDIDVIEIDGASNNSVEQARDLIANSIYRPARSPFKIYIIDEVHMLSNAAFNALLKTMEEPPEHVKFILCTTEPHKVPQTIQSRCQRFDFRAIPTPRIAEHIREILKQEKIKSDAAVIQQVARLGNGSMRDALSLLDRLLASGEGKLSSELLEQMLGLPDRSLIINVVDGIADQDPAAALRSMNELLDRGIALEQISEALIEHLRTLMIVSACPATDGVVELSDEEREQAAQQASRFDAPALVHMIVLLENVQRTLKFSSTSRALFDAAIVRLAQSEKFADAAALLRNDGGGNAAAPRLASAAVEKKKPAPVERKPQVESAASEERPTASATSAPPSIPPAPHPSNDDASLWPQLCNAIEQAMPALHSVLEHARLGRVTNDTVTLIADDAPTARAIETRAERMAGIVSEQLGRRIMISVTTDGESDRPAPEPAVESPAANAKLKEEAAKIPLVRQAMDVLDARIIKVEESSRSARP